MFSRPVKMSKEDEIMDGFNINDTMWMIANSYAYDEARKLKLKGDRAFNYVLSRRATIKEQLEAKTYKFEK